MMNPFHEAALLMQEAEQKHPGLNFQMEIRPNFVLITGWISSSGVIIKNRGYISWQEIEQGYTSSLRLEIEAIVNVLYKESIEKT